MVDTDVEWESAMRLEMSGKWNYDRMLPHS
jgi:hypothetical protein